MGQLKIKQIDGLQTSLDGKLTSVDLGYTASTRTITNTGGNDTVLPLFTSTEAGLVPLSGGGTTNFLRADGTWAAAGGADTNFANSALTFTADRVHDLDIYQVTLDQTTGGVASSTILSLQGTTDTENGLKVDVVSSSLNTADGGGGLFEASFNGSTTNGYGVKGQTITAGANSNSIGVWGVSGSAGTTSKGGLFEIQTGSTSSFHYALEARVPSGLTGQTRGLNIVVPATTRALIVSDGYTGLGTANPSTTLNVGGDTLLEGELTIQDGTEGTIGHVWTSTGVNGEGSWQAAAGGADGNGIYDGSGSLSGATTVTMATNDLIFASTGEANLLNIDTTNNRVGIGLAPFGGVLHVGGDTRIDGLLDVNGNIDQDTGNFESTGYGLFDWHLRVNGARIGGDNFSMWGGSNSVNADIATFVQANGNIALDIGVAGHIGVGVQSFATTSVNIQASTSNNSHLRLNAGATVITPADGDLWYNGTNLNFYDGTSTTDLLAGGGADGNGIYSSSSFIGADRTVTLSDGATTDHTLTFASIGEANLLYLDSLNDRIGIGQGTPTDGVHISKNVRIDNLVGIKAPPINNVKLYLQGEDNVVANDVIRVRNFLNTGDVMAVDNNGAISTQAGGRIGTSMLSLRGSSNQNNTDIAFFTQANGTVTMDVGVNHVGIGTNRVSGNALTVGGDTQIDGDTIIDNSTTAGTVIKGTGITTGNALTVENNLGTDLLNVKDSGEVITGIANTGKLAVGTTTPTARLEVKGTGTGTNQTFLVENSAGTDLLKITDNGEIIAGIASPGRFGIGTATPNEKLHIVGKIRNDSSTAVSAGSSSGTYLVINVGGTDYHIDLLNVS